MAASRIPGVELRFKVVLRNPSPDGGITPGDPLDLADYTNVFLYAFVKPNRMIAQFAKETTTDHLTMTPTSEPGEVTITIPASRTKGLRDTMIHLVPKAVVDDSGTPFEIGPDEGKSFEMVYITLNPLQ